MKIVILALFLSGCGAFDRQVTRYTGELTYKCSKSGVEYVQSDSGLAIHLDKEGKPVACSER